MLFNSFEFLIFFPVVVLAYFAIPFRFRWGLLLLASYYFYMCWKAEYILLILASTVIDYWASLRMARCTARKRRRKYLVLSLLVNLGILFGFKYFNFFNDSVSTIFQQFNIFYDVPAFQVLLPVGISFYTFQTLSYSIDVYRGQRQPEKHLGIFALYVAFFPQLVAGPIERSTHLIPQFRSKCEFDYVRVREGLQLMLWGIFKKVVIADRLAAFVNIVYQNPGEWQGLSLMTATVFFAFQIFCDFSGYSDIAIGAARVLGYDLMENFRRPYFAKSISEFWKRWHISLSTWFRDYVYFTLGGNRCTMSRQHLNVMVVFLVSGAWHGASWTFVMWGGVHGAIMIAERMAGPFLKSVAARVGLTRLPRLLDGIRVVWTFAIVCLAWVFFRAASVSDAFYILTHLGSGMPDWAAQCAQLNWEGVLAPFLLGQPLQSFLMAVAGIAVLLIIQLLQRNASIGCRLKSRPAWLRLCAYYAAISAILLFGVYEDSPFIYFQF